jgi:hypothetical protein
MQSLDGLSTCRASEFSRYGHPGIGWPVGKKKALP